MRAWMCAAAGLLAAAGAGLAAAALEGAYTAPSGATAEFGEDGVMHVSLPDGNVFAEAFVVEGDTLVITSAPDAPHDCPSTEGRYTFAETDEGVTFTLVADDCEPRRVDFTSGAWTKTPAE